MSGAGRILDIARQALSAQERAMNTTGHNIANVNTPGYSRQRVLFEANKPSTTSWGLIGTGVNVQTIERIRDHYIDTQIRSESQGLGQWQQKERIFNEIEIIYNEPSETGLSAVMRNFWDSWSGLSNDPQSASAREQVKQAGLHLAGSFNSLHDRLVKLQNNLNVEFGHTVREFNALLTKVADLNNMITSAESKDFSANDYRDSRTLLLEQLNEFADIQTFEAENGSVTITLDGNVLVEREVARHLGTKDRSLGYTYVTDPVMASTGNKINLSNGKMKALIEMRDEVIAGQMRELDLIADTIITNVNAIHQAGFGADGSSGRNFFDAGKTGASNIVLDSGIISSAANIAASADGTAGNGETALLLSELESEALMSGNTVTAEDFYAAMIGTLGVQSQEASFMRENQEMMVEHLKYQQDSVAGVSLDEEMTHLIRYQHAYQAAAKLVSTVDEMMQTVVNMV